MGDVRRRWRLHVALLAIGVVGGAAVTAWDFASPRTPCRGALPCIDYTGAAATGYWIVFAIQALVSTAAMALLVSSPRRFFRSHVIAASTLLASIAMAWVVMLAQPAHRRFAAGPSAPLACSAEPNESQSAPKAR